MFWFVLGVLVYFVQVMQSTGVVVREPFDSLE
jgi:hypothetical protein